VDARLWGEGTLRCREDNDGREGNLLNSILTTLSVAKVMDE
jgi:hypothetical protein